MVTTRTSIPASTANYYQGRIAAKILYIVVHDGETQELGGAAEGMGSWFQNPQAQGSAHKGTDSGSICTYVQDGDTAWGAPYVNADGLHCEQAGRSDQSALDWSDDYSRATIANTAIVCAEWHAQHGIPLRTMTDSQLSSRLYAGFITHAQATRVFGPYGGHTDPGLGYPLASMVNQAIAIAGGKPAQPTARPVPPTKIWLKVSGTLDRATRARTQQFLHVAVDGVWGLQSVQALQSWAGVPIDGSLGPQTWAGVQRVIGASPDGVPGPITLSLLQRYLNARP